jgi:hypothetical protein
VTTKKAVFWDAAPCRCGVNRRFGGTYCLHLQGRRKNKKIRVRRYSKNSCEQTSPADFLIFPSTLKIEAIHSSETSVKTTSIRCHIPEDCFLQKSTSFCKNDQKTRIYSSVRIHITNNFIQIVLRIRSNIIISNSV